MATMDSRDTNPTFRFLVEISGIEQSYFNECSLPAIEWEVQEIKEGGRNDYSIRLPGPQKGGTVILKSGMLSSMDLFKWYSNCMQGKWDRRTVDVRWLNAAHQDIMNWTLREAFPISVSSPTLKTDSNSIAVEELKLACHEIIIESV